MTLSQNTFTASLVVGVAGVTAVSLWAFDNGPASPGRARFPSPEEGGLVAYAADAVQVADDIVAGCKDGEEPQPCMETAVLDLVDSDGPTESIATFTELIKRDLIKGRGDFHDFVHRIGRRTAKKEGLNPDGFNRCPIDYNYACQHGFFEQALVQEPDAVKAAEKVCDPSKMIGKPLKFLFYCYHGVGHGVMMAKAYDVRDSLNVCEGFTGQQEKEGCYQGVFMENVVGFQSGTARSAAFSQADLLAPCNGLAPQHRTQCYLNHGGYLVFKAGTGTGAVERATLPCLKADPADIKTCLRSVGLNATNPAWQKALAPVHSDDFSANAATICRHFPAGYEEDCVVAGIDNLANFDRSDVTRMTAFCLAVPETFRGACFREIGFGVRNEVPAGTPPSVICSGVPEAYRPHCLSALQ